MKKQERRTSRRFDLALDLRYRLLDSGKVASMGSGRTRNISSGGVLFEADREIPAGRSIELLINWPVKLDGNCALQLAISGRVARHESDGQALIIERYQFRTRGMRFENAA